MGHTPSLTSAIDTSIRLPLATATISWLPIRYEIIPRINPHSVMTLRITKRRGQRACQRFRYPPPPFSSHRLFDHTLVRESGTAGRMDHATRQPPTHNCATSRLRTGLSVASVSPVNSFALPGRARPYSSHLTQLDFSWFLGVRRALIPSRHITRHHQPQAPSTTVQPSV